MNEERFSLGAHECDECGQSGVCPIEHIVKYFKDKEEEFDKVLTDIDNLIDSSFSVMLVQSGMSPQHMTIQVMLTGYIMGKGIEVKMPTLEEIIKHE